MNNPIRIPQVIGKVTKAGVESVVFNYYKNIDRSKIQFDFIVHDDSPYEIPDEIKKLGCFVFKVPPYKKLFSYIKALKLIFLAGNYKIVHSHMSTISVFTLFAAKLAKIPVRIVHSHATAGKGKGEFLRNTFKFFLRFFSKVYPTHLFACSQYAGIWMFGKNQFKKGNITVINNAIDSDNYLFNEKIRLETRTKLGINDKFVLGHVGRFMPQKNHSFLIDIFYEVSKRDKTAILLLVGEGELKKRTEKKVEQLGLYNVFFLGARDDVNELYQAMDVFILPSLYEGLPVVLVETQVSGLPSVVSNKVSPETKFTDIIDFVDSKKSASDWAEIILQKKSFIRHDISGELKTDKFLIKNEAKKLENIYIKITEGIK